MKMYDKLRKVKIQIGSLKKDTKNDYYKSMYFDINSMLEALEPLLELEGLILLQPIQDGFVTSVIIDTETNEEVVSSLKLPDIADPQKIGSCITYYRRYTLQSLLALKAEDDDGNSASNKVQDKKENQSNNKEWINVGSQAWQRAVAKKVPIDTIKQHYRISKTNETAYLEEIK